jgi:hypothetical protein
MSGGGSPSTPVYIPIPSPGLGYGGEEYGHSSYGSGAFPRQPISPNGGYGGAAYGLNSYGSVDITPPRVSSAISLDGYRIEVFFSEEMLPNAALFDPANYTLTEIIGAPATVVGVAGGAAGTLGGCTSMIIEHTGTTLGGTYVVTVDNVEDLNGNTLLPGANDAQLITLGDIATFSITATSGTTIQFAFFRSDATTPQDMLPEVDFTPGIESTSQYDITSSYPIPLTLDSLSQDTLDASLVNGVVSSMTSAVYDTEVGPADAIIYDGSILPSASTEFVGVEVGTGTSSASTATGLRLNKAAGNIYGWDWQDTSGRILPSSSYRADFTFNSTTAVFVPALYATPLGTFIFSDGVVQINLVINRVGSADVIDISSGGYTFQAVAAWSVQETTLSVVRNQKADHYTVLINGVPVLSEPTASFTGVPTISAGARFLLGTTYTISDFKVSELNVTSSQTIFTSAWNFLHSASGSFTGSPALANDRIITKRGPLVKGWGDATPATKNDVAIRINGTPVDVSGVNPYTGTIYPAIPIPLTSPGTNTIEVDYKWFPNPRLPMAGLNTPGLVLNKYDHHHGQSDDGQTPSPIPAGHQGSAATSRFPMALVLTPASRPQPIYIGHRYMAYERQHSALLNSPTTLRLNQSPHRVSIDPFSKECEGKVVTYNGETNPQLDGNPWELDGTDSGGNLTEGIWTVIDDSAGEYATGTAAYYYREEDFTCRNVVTLGARIQVRDWTADGVFTGVGFGWHDNHNLYMVGLIVVNGLHHVGLLLDGENPDLIDSWQIGPSATGTIEDGNTITFPTSEVPSSVEEGSQFQILDGSQAGIYTVDTCGILVNDDGTTTITIVETFPADPNREGNDTGEALFETPWDEQFITFRLITDSGTEQTQLFIGGTFAGSGITLTEATAYPAETSLLIRTGNKGQVFWGSLSRPATNTSDWSFYNYSITPESATYFTRGIIVSSDMGELPNLEGDNPWFITNAFGYAEIDSSGDTLLLKSTSNDVSEAIDLTYGYGRIEPFLTSKANVDVDAHFQVETGVLGAGDAIIRARDDIREARLATVMYRETGSARSLAQLDSASLSGLRTPEQAGWTKSSGNTLATPTVRGQILTFTKADGQGGVWYTTPTGASISTSLITGRVIEARLRFDSATAGAGDRIGFGFGADVAGRRIAVTFKTGAERVILTSNSGTDINSFPFTFLDGEFHTYRVLVESSTNTVALIIDDTVIGTAAYNLFDTSATERATIGAPFSEGDAVVEMDSFHVAGLAPSSVKRTLGVYLGGDETDIDNWALPRTDSTTAANSSLLATIKVMDWTALTKVRLHLDPRWGVSIYRPDIAPPPGFTGDFVTEVTDPTAAWINVEYRRLPRHSDMFGSVAWGALDPGSVTQQRWKRVAYRIYTKATEEYIAPQGMVLNRYNVIHSGEFNNDTTPEVVTITSLTNRIVSIRSADQNASRIFNVVVDDTVLPSTAWVFNEDTQTIILSSALPSNRYPVTVTFAPAKPVTVSYLCKQPFDQSVTKLNEGTPPVPLSQRKETTISAVFGSQLNDPNDKLNTSPDFVLNNPYRHVEYSNDPDALYDSLQFCTVDDGGQTGLLSIACDGPAPEEGWIEMALDGTPGAYHDQFGVPGGVGGPWGSQSPSIGGTASQIDQTFTLMVSGGSFQDGVLAGGVALSTRPPVLYPNAGSGSSSAVASENFGLNQETKFYIKYSTPTNPLEDSYVLSPEADNTPPSDPNPDTSPNPDGTPGTQLHGAAIAEMVDHGTTDGVSRLGPWGGLESLEPQSLLGGGTNDPSPGTMFFTLNGGAALPSATRTTFVLEAAN